MSLAPERPTLLESPERPTAMRRVLRGLTSFVNLACALNGISGSACDVMASSVDENVHEPWGWTQYFTELSTFLLSLERQFGIANEAFAEYAD